MSYREEKEEVVFEIGGPKGALELIPQRRTYRVDFVGMKDIAKEQIRVCIDGKEVQAVVSYNRKLQAVEVCVGEDIYKSRRLSYFTRGAAESGKSGGRAVLCISGSGGNQLCRKRPDL